MARLGAMLSGQLGAQGHYANGLAAFYIATGQDAACVSESAIGFTRMERRGDDLFMSVTLPNMLVGSVGGGTGLPSQAAGAAAARACRAAARPRRWPRSWRRSACAARSPSWRRSRPATSPARIASSRGTADDGAAEADGFRVLHAPVDLSGANASRWRGPRCCSRCSRRRASTCRRISPAGRCPALGAYARGLRGGAHLLLPAARLRRGQGCARTTGATGRSGRSRAASSACG